MSDFDPYYKWLAIPPAEQPPNHYRLLGVPLFTTDADVLENAADQRMSHLRSFQTGKNSQESQKLLNEVAQARACLLNPQKRAAYDATLRPAAPIAAAPIATAPVAAARVAAAPVSAVRPIPVASPAPPVAPPSASPPMQAVSRDQAPLVTSRGSAKKRHASKSPIGEIGKHIAGSLAGLFWVYLLVCWFSAAWDKFGLFHDLPTVTKIDPSQVSVPVDQPITPPQPPAIKPTVNPKIERPVVTPKRPDPKPQPPMVTPRVEPKVETTPEQLAEQKQQQLNKLKDERTVAVEKGEISQALRLTDELAKLEDLDLLAEKVRIIAALQVGERSVAEVMQLTTMLIDLATEAILSDRGEFAAEQATAALLLARKSGDQDLVRKATRLVLDVQEKQTPP